VPGCCEPQGYDRVFGDRFARRQANRYRRKGLNRTQQRMVDFLVSQGIDGAHVLEIGGGVGELQLELLRRGAARATNLELVAAYDVPARRLAEEAGLADRVERRVLDIARSPHEVEPADVVVMHRVVCCYPDYARLLGAAGDHARHLLVFSHPPGSLFSRGVHVAQNLVLRVVGSTFRTFAHPPAEMLRVLEERGLRSAYVHRGAAWYVNGLVRG
jgi:magnesium-protoporphyrin O-methyltransferase